MHAVQRMLPGDREARTVRYSVCRLEHKGVLSIPFFRSLKNRPRSNNSAMVAQTSTAHRNL